MYFKLCPLFGCCSDSSTSSCFPRPPPPLLTFNNCLAINININININIIFYCRHTTRFLRVDSTLCQQLQQVALHFRFQKSKKQKPKKNCTIFCAVDRHIPCIEKCQAGMLSFTLICIEKTLKLENFKSNLVFSFCNIQSFIYNILSFIYLKYISLNFVLNIKNYICSKIKRLKFT